ncbi:MAG: hypothetical protein ACFFDT_22320 [Candidatus Hodarchaeota archaeon]
MRKHTYKRKTFIVSFSLIIFLLGISNFISVSALTWDVWKDKAVGDVNKNHLDDYWDIASTPKSGWEAYLWDSWTDVLFSEQPYSGGADKDLEFSTYSDVTMMGYIELTSKASFSGVERIGLKITMGCKYTYPQEKTLGYVYIWDLTTNTAAYTFSITCSTNPNEWKWESFIFDEWDEFKTLNPSHSYKIKLRGRDAWLYQKVSVVWEKVKILLAPREVSFYHFDHDLPATECPWRASAKWSPDGIRDLQRDRIPYGGSPFGWNPCTIFEFRSYPYYALEAIDNWYHTNFPGSIGFHDSAELEEQDDGYEEVEAYTRTPSYFQPYIEYYWQFYYDIEYITGWVRNVFELELGNEHDWFAVFSPPAYPADYYILDEVTIIHWPFEQGGAQKSYVSSSLSKSPDKAQTEVFYNETHPQLDIHIVGKSPYYLEVWSLLNINSKADLMNFLETRMSDLSVAFNDDILLENELIYVTTTFNQLVSPQDFIQFVLTSGLEVESFHYKAINNGEFSRGQATPYNDELFPLDKINRFITPAELLGIYRVDGYLNISKVSEVQKHPQVLLLDFSAFRALLNSNAVASEIMFYTEDPFWLMETFVWN